MCQNTNCLVRNCWHQNKSLGLANLALPPGKTNTKRNLKTTGNVVKTTEPVWNPCGSSRERDINLFEEKAQRAGRERTVPPPQDARCVYSSGTCHR